MLKTMYAILFTFLSNALCIHSQTVKLIQLEATTIKASEILPDILKDTSFVQHSFETTDLITLREYKEFLSFLKSTYAEKHFRRFLPDSSIVTNRLDYEKYLNDPIYENYPALGISWENAISFCIWKSRQEQLDLNSQYYRFPNLSEYAAIHKYHDSTISSHLVHDDYSEWSIVSKDESYNFYRNQPIHQLDLFTDYVYIAENDDVPALKRKIVLGNNFHFKRHNLFFNEWYSFYQNKGYPFVGFRLVKATLNSEHDSAIYESLIKYYDYH